MEIIHICLFTVFLVFIPTIIVADDRDGCPTNLSRDQYLKVHGGKCYQFDIHRHLSWPKAESECRSRGGHLVKLENLAEEEFIMGVLRSFNFHGQGVWIGLARLQDGASFTWVTGEPMQFQYWAPGQPGSGSRRRRLLLGNIQLPTGLPSLHLPKLLHEDCVLLKYSDSGHWHDYPCEKLDFIGLVPENYPYVCEYPHSNTAYKSDPKPDTTTPITTAKPTTTTPAPDTDLPTTQAPTTNLPTTTTTVSPTTSTTMKPTTQVTDKATTETSDAPTSTSSASTHTQTEVVVIG